MRTTPAALLAAALLAGCGGAASTGGRTLEPTPPARSPIPAGTSAIPDVTPPPAGEPAKARAPRLSDFKLGVKIRSKQCFGDAGCSIEVEPTLAWVGPAASRPGPDDTYDLTYEIIGGEDGPVTGTITTHGTTYDTPIGTGLTTTSKDQKLTIRGTILEKR